MRTYNAISNDVNYAYSVPMFGGELDEIEGYHDYTEFNIWVWTSEASMELLRDRIAHPQDYYIDNIDEFGQANYAGNDDAIERLWQIFNKTYKTNFA